MDFIHIETLLPQTSLIPITVSLIRYLEARGLIAFWENYPFWYLGSTDFRFLVGPVFPIFVVAIKKVFSQLSLFDITALVVFASYLLGIWGWVRLAKEFGYLKSKGTLILFVILAVFLPWRLFYSFSLSEPTLIVARNLVSWLFLFLQLQKRWQFMAMSVLLLLINTSVIPFMLVGALSIEASRRFRNLKTTIKDVIYSLVIATVWYTPSYWISILTNPSVGGVSGFKLVTRLVGIIREVLPVALAVLAVANNKRKLSSFEKFIFVYTGSFLFLSLFRFISDIDYWTDWSIYFYELELALVILFLTNRKWLLAFTLPIYMVYRIGGVVIYPYDIKYVLDSTHKFTGTEKVFFSGSTVFWANAYYDYNQLRGGRDQVSSHPNWDIAAHELREGSSPDKSIKLLQELDIKYVLVHSGNSAEYYKDFKHLNKWPEIGEVVWSQGGDLLYRIK